MAIDGVFLHLLKNELYSCIGAKVQKIFQPIKDTLIISLKSRDMSGKLLMCAGASNARVHLTSSAVENPASPPMFCMLMRKHLSGATLTDILQLGIDRVLFFVFDAMTELGDRAEITVILEILGGQSNILLCRRDEGQLRIIDCLRRTDAEAKRLLLPGAVYEPPVSHGGLNLLEADESKAADAVMSAGGNLDKAFRDVFEGVSPLVARELAFRCGKGAEKDEITNAIKWLKSIISEGGSPALLIDEDDKIIAFTYFPPKQYGSKITKKTFASYSQLLDAYYTGRDAGQQQKELTSQLVKAVSNLSARAQRKLLARQKDLNKSRDREHLKKYGELIHANLHKISPGASFCDADDYYNDMKLIRIPLDPALSAAANAQKYFKEYKKAAAAEKMLGSLISQSKEECRYLSSVLDSLSRVSSISEINEISDELISEGYLKRKTGGKARMKQRALGPIKFVTDDAFTVLVGRNNRQNDELTLRRAAPGDIWLHVKDAPGSHVIIECGGKEPPFSSIEQAAVIACTYSSASMSANVPVDYTAVKNVKKPGGAKPGMVIYKTNRTIYATPSKELCEKLRIKN